MTKRQLEVDIFLMSSKIDGLNETIREQQFQIVDLKNRIYTLNKKLNKTKIDEANAFLEQFLKDLEDEKFYLEDFNPEILKILKEYIGCEK